MGTPREAISLPTPESQLPASLSLAGERGQSFRQLIKKP